MSSASDDGLSHLLVTNDFPPKDGGIQVYLWELWRRLEPGSFTVFTASSHPDAKSFDESLVALGHQVHRSRFPVLGPTPDVVSTIRRLAAETGADLVVIDPVFPLGLVGPSLGIPYAVVVHGAETSVPGRIPGLDKLMRSVISRSVLAICAGDYPAEEVRHICGRRTPPIVVVPPGVDTNRFGPLDTQEKAKAREAIGVPAESLVVASISRLVPRKGMDAVIGAAAGLMGSFGNLAVVIGGEGRDEKRLRRLTQSTGAPVKFLGRVSDLALPDLYGLADVFVMACRDRWFGLEQEGFGIVFLEAAACEVPHVAGRSGGSVDAVIDGETGIVLDDPADPGEVAGALRVLLSQPELRRSMGDAGRRRVVASYDYDGLALRLAGALREMGG
jgi:phosphatidylinositol alpha-1,6-mannosyltransferase